MLRINYIKMSVSLLLMLMCITANAQKQEKVHGKYTLTIGDNERITPFEARLNCIKHARDEAIKEKFPELISSNTNMADVSINGKVTENFYEEITISSRAEWLSNTRPPVITASYENGKLIFTAEVWGEAREIVQAKPEFDWKILCGGTTDNYENNVFKHKERCYIKFRSPVAGYVAIYLLDSYKKDAQCLLPYRNNNAGFHKVNAGEQYIFFDKGSDPTAIQYGMTTEAPYEIDNVVLIFSPNQFIKCLDVTNDYHHPNSLSIDDFEKWLRRLRNKDKELVVDRSRFIHIMKE